MKGLMAPAVFQVNLNKPFAPSVALTGRWGCRKLLQAVPHWLISTTVAKGFWCEVFTGRMPFLSPNQQHQSTEGNWRYSACKTPLMQSSKGTQCNVY